MWSFLFRSGLILGFILVAITGCEQRPEETAPAPAGDVATAPQLPQECRLVMGWDPWEPYQYRDARGEVTGLDIEIAVASAEAADCELEFVEGQWMNLLTQLRDGEIGMLGGATRTPGREEFAEFTAPYRSESFLLFTRADDGAAAIPDLDALRASDLKVGVVAEYYYGEELTPLLDELEAAGRLVEAPIAELNYTRLLDGEIDVFIEDPFVAARLIRTRGFFGIEPIDTRINAADVSFMLSREGATPEAINRFREGLESIRETGRLEEIITAYKQ